MTALTFPTIAQKALAQWERRRKTTSTTVIAQPFNGERDDSWNRIEWVFDDDMRLCIEGLGKAHKIWAELP